MMASVVSFTLWDGDQLRQACTPIILEDNKNKQTFHNKVALTQEAAVGTQRKVAVI